MKNICLITGSRAEYGIMKPLIEKLNNDSSISLDIVATAMHMEEKYGYTYKVIEKDGYNIVKKINLNLVDTSKKTVVRSISKLQVELSALFEEKNYDLIIILGDRYEMLAVANTALIYNIPVCHLHGGEKTLGNFDEYIRHSITKMSHLHLVAADDFRKRVIQLGENPTRVINTGALGVENALNVEYLEKEKLEEKINAKLEKDYNVVLFHPVTLDTERDAVYQIEQLLSALEEVDRQFVFIGSNSDTGSDIIMDKIRNFVDKKENRYLFSSLTTREYHSLLKYSKGLIGNSSSGLIEVPSLNKPTLNIGDRQKGRLSGQSVINVPCKSSEILKGLERMDEVKDFSNPYEQKNSSKKAYKAIITALNKGVSTSKDFYDLEVE